MVGNMKILLVEDEENLRKILEKRLKKQFTVDVCGCHDISDRLHGLRTGMNPLPSVYIFASGHTIPVSQKS